MIIEFSDSDSQVFDEIIELLEKCSRLQRYGSSKKSKLLLAGLEIYPEQRKVYYNAQEVDLTVKEYDLLYLLAVNKGRILTYSQIYERVWKEEPVIDEKKVIGFHIRNLREKLYKSSSKILFTIKCVREVGYCLELN